MKIFFKLVIVLFLFLLFKYRLNDFKKYPSLKKELSELTDFLQEKPHQVKNEY